MLEQLKEIDPSAKEPLFRRLMGEESLAYLREKDLNTIIGFEIDLSATQRLAGFTLIAIQKHTIYAYRSDLSEEPKLVLFPPLDKLFDQAFDMLKLKVIKKEFTDARFVGKELARGRFDELVKDLTPPEKEVDIPAGVSDRMVEHMKRIQNDEAIPNSPYAPEDVPVQVTETGNVIKAPEPIPDEAPEDVLNEYEDDPYAGFEEGVSGGYGYDSYDDEPIYEPEDEPIEPAPSIMTPEPKPEDDPRTIKLKNQSFGSLSEVSDFVATRLGVPKPIATDVVNKALQSNVVPEHRIALAVRLFEKLFNEKKL